MRIIQTLYKRTSTGAVQQWAIELNGSGGFRTISGQVDGKLTTTNWTQCKPKNVGKANETSPSNQAISEATAKYDKKCREDFFVTPADVDTSSRIKPTLAKNFEDEVDGIAEDEAVDYQPKLDGFRGVFVPGKAFARSGLPIVAVPHIIAAYEPVFKKYPNLEAADGELYSHEHHDNFNKISSILKKQTPELKDLEVSKQFIKHHVYDVIAPGMLWSERKKIVQELNDVSPYIVVVQTETGTKHDAWKWHGIFKKKNYEGAIARRNSLYEHKRSKFVLKIKDFQDKEYPIRAIREGNGDGGGLAKSVELETETGKVFSVGVIGDDDYTRELFERRVEFIGQMGTVVFFNLTPGGIPRFGKLKTVRWDLQ